MMEGQKRLSELFRSVKSAVTARQAAEMYGLKVNRAGMACCPFHNDRAPSLKLDDRFYCFGCGKGGDVFTFTQLYQHCDFHTAFLLLGGTDRAKGERQSRKETLELYRAKKAREARIKQEQKMKQQLQEIGLRIDYWRDKLLKAEPMTNEWAEAYNHWQLACYRQAEALGEDLEQL